MLAGGLAVIEEDGLARHVVMARPRPRRAPVTMATFPSSRSASGMREGQAYRESITLSYLSRITFRFTLRVGVRKPLSTVKSSGRIENFLILA